MGRHDRNPAKRNNDNLSAQRRMKSAKRNKTFKRQRKKSLDAEETVPNDKKRLSLLQGAYKPYDVEIPVLI